MMALAALVAAFIVACGGDEPELVAGEEPSAPTPQFERPKRVLKPGHSARAVVETSQGDFEIDLDTQGSPKTTNSFAFLAEEGFYDGLTFHRIVPGFVVQGGDPTGDGTGGPGYSVDEPPPPRTEYLRGTVAMAKTAAEPAGRSGSQFFVVAAADAGLPPQYAVLGEVSADYPTVKRISELGDPASGQTGTPLEQVTIERVTIETR
jgi:cyclophilin family peptidyl-prolyl cis-trans isomerase